MAWRGDDDLWNADHDSLFADPTGARGGYEDALKPRVEQRSSVQVPLRRTPMQQSPTHAPPGSRGGNAPPNPPDGGSASGAARQEGEQSYSAAEDGTWIGGMLWWLVAGGKQCCSMRDRSDPKDVAAAQRAAEMGRPPEFQSAQPHSPFPPAESPAVPDVRQPAATAAREGPPAMPLQHSGASHPTVARDQRPSVEPTTPAHFAPEPRQQSAPEPKPESLVSSPASLPVKSPEPRPRSPSHDSWGDEIIPAGHGLRRDDMQERGKTTAPAGAESSEAGLPDKWDWPPWCLSATDPCIEVYVVDEDTGEGRWCMATPKERIKDPQKRDAFLCCVYEWDDEAWEQDFGPKHIRRIGQKTTVLDILTKTAKPLRAPDTGKGVSRLLDDTT